MSKIRHMIAPVLVAILASVRGSAQPSARTAAEFDRYVGDAEARIGSQRNSAETFLSVDSLSAARRSDTLSRLQKGEIVIEQHGSAPKAVSGGLIHDWTGTVLIPGTTVAHVLAVVRDYDHLDRYYSPDVMQSRILSHNSNDDFHIFMRLRKHKVITVILDTEYDVHYARLDAAHQYSLSRSTRVSEIADPGTPNEHAIPAGHDHGFMWRLNSYWAFEQAGDGVLVECEAVSLTRDVPTGLGWLIGPFVYSIPRESLQFTLKAMRDAVAGESSKRQ